MIVMDKILVAGYTVQDALMLAGILIGIFIFISILKKIFRKDKVNPHMQFAVCQDCGWQGQVSRHAGRCPGCNQPLGDRMRGQSSRNVDQVAGH
jgi:hypothetical protein